MAKSKLQPHNFEAENAILGALLLEGREAVPRVVETLKPTDFYEERHRLIYTAILALFEAGTPIDVVTVTGQLRNTGELEAAGGPAKLAILMEEAAIAVNLSHYAAAVRDKALLRELIQVATKTVDAAMADSRPAAAILEETEAQLFRLAERQQTGQVVRFDSLLKPAFERLEQLYERKEHVTGLATGLYDLDLQTSGLQPQDLILIAGRPSTGKTAFALNIAAHTALTLQKSVLVLSLEMSAPQLVQRLLCAEARVDMQGIRTGHLMSTDWHKLSVAAGRLTGARLFIDDSPGLTVLEARAKARRTASEHGLDLLVIDYLQLMRGTTGIENRQQEISEISRSLKALAKELAIPVIALSQLSRAVEQRRGDHRPQLSDLRESGSLEQDADLVLFLYRPAMYMDPGDPEYNPADAEVLLGKQRNGPIGTVPVVFLPHYGRFDNRSERGS